MVDKQKGELQVIEENKSNRDILNELVCELKQNRVDNLKDFKKENIELLDDLIYEMKLSDKANYKTIKAFQKRNCQLVNLYNLRIFALTVKKTK